MLSPDTLPRNASVTGMGFLIETFHATSSPAIRPSKISEEDPSTPVVPISVPAALLTLSIALRSPSGVLIVRFQFPSTAILRSPPVALQRVPSNGKGLTPPHARQTMGTSPRSS